MGEVAVSVLFAVMRCASSLPSVSIMMLDAWGQCSSITTSSELPAIDDFVNGESKQIVLLQQALSVQLRSIVSQ